MIDPKFNEIPADETEEFSEEDTELLTDEDTEIATGEDLDARSQATPRRGLSINDTIARDANRSVGGQGVDTSGVGAGAGAGAGSTSLTPTDEGSPAPQISPGRRSTGTTAAGDARSGKTSTDRTNYDK